MPKLLWDSVESSSGLLFSNANQTCEGVSTSTYYAAYAEKGLLEGSYYWETIFDSIEPPTTNTSIGLTLAGENIESGIGTNINSIAINLSNWAVTFSGQVIATLNAPAGASTKRIRHWADTRNKVYRIAFQDEPDVWHEVSSSSLLSFKSTKVWIFCARMFGPTKSTIYGSSSDIMFNLPAGLALLSDSPYDYNSEGLSVSESDYQNFLVASSNSKVLLVEAEYASGTPSVGSLVAKNSEVVISKDKYSALANSSSLTGASLDGAPINFGDKKYFEVRLNNAIEISSSGAVEIFIGVNGLPVGAEITGSFGISTTGKTRTNNIISGCIDSIAKAFSIDAIFTVESEIIIGDLESGTFSIDAVFENANSVEQSDSACGNSPFSTSGILLQTDTVTTTEEMGSSTAVSANGDLSVIGNGTGGVVGASVWIKNQYTGNWGKLQTLGLTGTLVTISPSGQFIVIATGVSAECYYSAELGSRFELLGTYTAPSNMTYLVVDDSGQAFICVDSSASIYKVSSWSV